MTQENTFLGLIGKGFKENWDKPALSDYNGATYTYSEFALKIAGLHIIFETIGLKKGDRVAICGRNSAHWAVSFFATISYGAVPTTILHDFDAESIHNIVNHSESKLLFAGEHIWERIDPQKMPMIETLIVMDDFSVVKSRSSELNELCANMDKATGAKFPNGFSYGDMYFHEENSEELALLNYTSGTTSTPKGVMIPYRSLWSNTKFAIESIPFVKSGDGIVSMLPMAHMYGLAFEILLSVAKGCHVHFLTRVPSPQIIMAAFDKVKPTLVIAVPLIIEKIVNSRVLPELNKQPVKTLLKLPVIKEKIYAKVRQKLIDVFGGRIVEVVIGGAALDTKVGDFLTRIRFPYTVGYGMTECGPLVAYDYWETYRATSCGLPVDRMEVKIDSENPASEVGELLVRGANTMLGYLKNPETTQAVLSPDGWLRTGDLVLQDKAGYIYIKGRSKTMILGPSGQNIYPEEIEQLLNNTPYVAESLIVERGHKLHALIFPDKETLDKEGVDVANLQQIFENEIKVINQRLPKYCPIAGITLRDEEFEKTPKRSIKRFLYK